ncbi:helix-turn-helix domain-containing protein [Virgibacillus salexigens]|uniref:HTH-type transcriptional regulator ImmR n=1 Tax=Virgibacillus massiliensis TaxID=1462526 RepID=A0A024QBD8_9BACI|nr:helix-turn-helix transcriptional regulator [Virgibacillus massiliensis]CDQ39567.1 HTH-type transcriptional regulator ImmR [Virgibacillus massiliensis]
MDLDQEIGKRLRELRETKGFTTREAGRKIGVSNSYVSKIENGSIPSLSILQKLCNLYSVTIPFLLTNKDEAAKKVSDNWYDCIEKLKANDISPTQTLSYVETMVKIKESLNLS